MQERVLEIVERLLTDKENKVNPAERCRRVEESNKNTKEVVQVQ